MIIQKKIKQLSERGFSILVNNEHIRALHYFSREPVLLTIRDGVIHHIERLDKHSDADTTVLESLPFIGPGLVDLQINGYQGFDLNEAPHDPKNTIEITRRLWAEGVTSYFPTITSSSITNIENALGAIAKACLIDPDSASAVAGIHLEGPFISPQDGARGAHLSEDICSPDWELFQRWQNAAHGKIQIITMSPEWPESIPFIERCVASGVKVSIGHTAATPEQIRDAVFAGARMSTHLGNGAHLQLPRHPNYIWEQLASDELHPCLIADGFHLPISFIKVVLKAKPDKAMLVSDAVHLSGLPAGRYHSHGRNYVILTEEGRLHLEKQPELLAGSAQMLGHGISHLVRSGVCSLSDAWDMGSIRPSAFMNLRSQEGLRVGAPADLVLFKWSGERVQILKTFKKGIERNW